MTASAVDELAATLEVPGGPAVRRAVPLAEFSTYRLGGPAALLVEAAHPDHLDALRAARAGLDVPVLVVGRGSNLLVGDAGFPGVALRLVGDFEQVAPGESEVVGGGGVALPVLARRSAAAGASGLEFYVGIPGTVGGAVRMNAGGHGRETRDVLLDADVFDLAAGATGGPATWPADRFEFDYRRSSLGPAHVVVAARFAATAAPPEECGSRIEEIVRWRREHQPGGSNAGSVFTNPPGDSAGRLIDACGLKGMRVGGAVVSEKHANFFQAEAGATAADVYALVAEVRRRVAEETGVELVPELTFVGFDPPGAGG